MDIAKKNIELDQIYGDVSTLLQAFGVEHWFECGTLLGLIRNSNYLPWEVDIDIGGWLRDVWKIESADFRKKARASGLEYVVQDSTVTFWRGEGVYLDINFYHDAGSIWEMARWLPTSKTGKFYKLLHRVASSPRYYPFQKRINLKSLVINFSKLAVVVCGARRVKRFAEIQLQGKQIYKPWRVPSEMFDDGFVSHSFREFSVLVPIRSRDYLNFRYGSGWENEDRSWNTELQDGSII